MTTKTWNPRYSAYATSHGRKCEDMITYDTKKWPGGKMCGFILWIREQWNIWAEESGEQRDSGGHFWPEQHEKFDKWLQESLA